MALLFLFGPFWIVERYNVPPPDIDIPVSNAVVEEEVTVGIAVIARATARRLLSTAVHNVLRTTVGTFSRAASRTFLRRLIRFIVRTLFGVLAIDLLFYYGFSGIPALQAPRHPVVAVGLGVVALSLSFFGILHVIDPHLAASVTTGAPLSYLTCSVLAGLPLAVYGGIHAVAARWLDVDLHFNTSLDGLLLQAYFTGAGSFLPMTTDIEYVGSSRNNMRMAFISLMSMFVVHLGLTFVGHMTGSVTLRFAGAMFLLYCFVYMFPIRPLEGYDIWCANKGLWLVVFIPILIAFFLLPEEFIAMV
jgi:hypothetical protein